MVGLCYSRSMNISGLVATDAATASAIAAMHEHGYRTTEPRRQVVSAVLLHSKPFTAEQIVAELPAIGRSTVYRTLEILASLSQLSRLLQPSGNPAYVVTLPGHRHHLVCSSCGTVVSFTACPVESLVPELTRDTDFAIQGHHLEVFGICPGCQTNPEPSASN
jgi:Fur family transcriptional regulator, ferric uptake regulator